MFSAIGRALMIVLLICLGLIFMAWILGVGGKGLVAKVKAGATSDGLGGQKFFINPFDVIYGKSDGIAIKDMTLFKPLLAPKGLPQFSLGEEKVFGSNNQTDSGSGNSTDRATSRDMVIGKDVTQITTNGPQKGDVSQHSGTVTFTDRSSSPEFLTFSVQKDMSLDGWSVESLTSGIRVAFPQEVFKLRQGVVNTPEILTVQSGDRIILSSTRSPVGVSFQENVCTYILSRSQTFIPSLTPCTDGACLLEPYPNCVTRFENFPTPINSHRLYLNSSQPLWRQRDTLRLLDENGLVIDIIKW
jgi:hypothetical protein